MLADLKRILIESGLSAEDRERVDRAAVHVNSAGFDDWGLDPATLKATLVLGQWLYRKYFRVETAGMERIPKGGRLLVIANHGGQLPLDGMMVGLSMLLEAEPPRIVRGMVERWFPSLPFVSTLFMRCGQMVGDHRNCRELLEREECVMVFPEGVKGSGKTIFDRYKLQRFGTGFVRLALETKTPILPVAIIGCEETYPSIYDFKPLARMVGAPYLPVTPFWPLLGPIGALPLPAKVTLRFAEPLVFHENPGADADAPDSVVQELVDRVRSSMEAEIREGLARRGDKIFTGSAK